MERLGGERLDHGLTVAQLVEIEKMLSSNGQRSKRYDLRALVTDQDLELEEAAVLVAAPRAADAQPATLVGGATAAALYHEMEALVKDTKYLEKRRNKVLNKQARHNLCFGEKAQEPNIKKGKGRVYEFDRVPELNKLRLQLKAMLVDVGALPKVRFLTSRWPQRAAAAGSPIRIRFAPGG